MSVNIGDSITRLYGNFRGVDFRGDEINLVRSPDSLNVWKDYKETESIRTRPGVKLNAHFDDTVYGIYFYHGSMIVHSGTNLYIFDKSDGSKAILHTGVEANESNAFVYNDIWYFKDGKNYLQYDGESVAEVVGYIPTTTIGKKPMGGGTKHEDVNLLSPYRINTFLADGVSKEYYLDVLKIDSDYSPIIKINDSEDLDIRQDYQKDEGGRFYSIDLGTAYKAIYDDAEGAPMKFSLVFVHNDEHVTIISDEVSESFTFKLISFDNETDVLTYEYNGEIFTNTIDSGVDDGAKISSLIYWGGDVYEVMTYSVDYEEGKIIFSGSPKAPLTDGQDNVSIQFRKSYSTDAEGNAVNIEEKYSNLIKKCTLLQVFDNRVFVSGNSDHPNMLWHCSLDDPTYFSDLDYYQEGMDASSIRGMVAGNNALWVFRQSSDANTNVFYHTPAIDEEYGKIYPSSHSSITLGCVGRAINFNDDIVFFSERGMEGISGDITTEQVVAHRSSLVDRKLISAPNYSNMHLEEWEGYLFVFIDNKAFLADSRAVFTNENHVEYEWFYWELEKNVTCTRVHDGILYIGSTDGIYSLSASTTAEGVYETAQDPSRNIESFWTTPKDKFKVPNKLKTTNKKGCVIEATGDVTILAKTENSDFELIESYENVTDSIVCRIKRKKFKDIQLKFYSKTRFSLETATLECFIGGYLKH